MSLAYAFQVRNDQNGADFWGEKKKSRAMEHTTGIVLHWVKWAVCGLGLGTLFLYCSLRRRTKETLEGTRNLLVLFLLNHHYGDLQGFTGYDYPWQDNYNWKGAATCGEGRLATPSPWQLPWSIDLLRIVYRLYTIVGQHYNTLLHLWPSWEAHSQPYLHKVWPQNPPKPHGLPKVPQRYSKGLARWDVKTTNLGPRWFSRWQRASAGGNKHQIDRKDWKQMGKQKQQAEPTSLKSFDI